MQMMPDHAPAVPVNHPLAGPIGVSVTPGAVAADARRPRNRNRHTRGHVGMDGGGDMEMTPRWWVTR